ncbi:hypothetical protein OGAPHI_001314 [Ogataea philodendri]|uniref:Major facilitator superfamily (MFS) profile domain-containing protein n=1 Tax=Ogataea philodendri TaxID=1378263 RepID=A0A9P8PEH6_9ASCO|nr:uncharacterized protein OGAPHI_001314 [Ogataea philodendri]KAH3670798.1 hypothetical protein OGAPHI_001314 [Ogataea philodendri]
MVIELNHSGFNPVLFSSSRGSPSLDPDATSESVREAQREGSVERAQTTIEEVDILNKDRKDGKQVSLMGTMSGLGAVFSVMVLLRLPVFYGGSRTAKKAMELSYYSVGVLAFLTSVFMWFCAYKNSHDLCFKSKDPAQFHNERNNDALSEGIQSPDVDALGNSPKLESEESYLDSLKAGVRLSLEDPAILIAYLCGFLSRCITIIITLYIPFYVNRYFKDSGKCAKSFSEKIECPESYILSSILTGIANLFGLLLAPVSGILIDRLSNFTLLLMIAIGVSLTSFVSFCWVSQPDHSGLVYVSSALMGSAQILLIIISMTMLSNITSREKYKKRKGSISGVFAFVGGIGIIFTSYVGGLLADMNAKYPFILAAIANVVCGVIITISSRQNFRSIRLV